MKFIKLEYPDQSIHNVMVHTFGYNKKLNKYFIRYYDMAQSEMMYTILERNGDTFLKDPFQDNTSYTELMDNYQELDLNLLPKEIACKKTAEQTEAQTVSLFTVYNTGHGLYINENLCQRFNIGKKYKPLTIKGIKCYEVNTEEIDKIEKTTENQNPALKAKYENVYETQVAAKFIVYHTINTNEYFIRASICEEYGIKKLGITTIEGITHYKVTKDDIERIETLTANSNPCLKAEYRNIYLKIEKTEKTEKTEQAEAQAVALFIVYHTMNTNEYFIRASIREKYGIKGLEITTIEGITHYKVTKEDIEKIEKLTANDNPCLKADYRNIYLKREKIEQTEKEQPTKQQSQKTFTYYNDLTNHKLYIDRTIYELAKVLKIKIEGNAKIIDNKNCYSLTLTQLKQIEQASKYEGIEKRINLEKDDTIVTPVIAYQEKNTGTVYLPTKYNLVNPENHNLKRIMNKECIEITMSELEQIYNQKIIIVSVYLKQRKKQQLVVCSFRDKFYISEDDIIFLTNKGIVREKIKVDGQIYYRITENDMVEIKKNARDQEIEIEFSFKSITPIEKNSVKKH